MTHQRPRTNDVDTAPRSLEEALDQISELQGMLAASRTDAAMLRIAVDMLSTTDPITGLSNDGGLLEALEKAAARTEIAGEPFGLLCVDFDALEGLERRAGRDVLEDHLRHIGAVIGATLRGIDTVGRIDDRSFVAVVPMLSEGGVSLLTSSIASAFAADPSGSEAGDLVPAFSVVLSNAHGIPQPARMMRELVPVRERTTPGATVIVHSKAAVDDGDIA